MLAIWTVYDHPTDFPDWYVARKHVVAAGGTVPTDQVVKARTLDEVRELLPPGLVCLTRSRCDDPKIVESWL